MEDRFNGNAMERLARVETCQRAIEQRFIDQEKLFASQLAERDKAISLIENHRMTIVGIVSAAAGALVTGVIMMLLRKA